MSKILKQLYKKFVVRRNILYKMSFKYKNKLQRALEYLENTYAANYDKYIETRVTDLFQRIHL